MKMTASKQYLILPLFPNELHHNLLTWCVFTVSVAGPRYCPLEDLFALHVVAVDCQE